MFFRIFNWPNPVLLVWASGLARRLIMYKNNLFAFIIAYLFSCLQFCIDSIYFLPCTCIYRYPDVVYHQWYERRPDVYDEITGDTCCINIRIWCWSIDKHFIETIKSNRMVLFTFNMKIFNKGKKKKKEKLKGSVLILLSFRQFSSLKKYCV